MTRLVAIDCFYRKYSVCVSKIPDLTNKRFPRLSARHKGAGRSGSTEQFRRLIEAFKLWCRECLRACLPVEVRHGKPLNFDSLVT